MEKQWSIQFKILMLLLVFCIPYTGICIAAYKFFKRDKRNAVFTLIITGVSLVFWFIYYKFLAN